MNVNGYAWLYWVYRTRKWHTFIIMTFLVLLAGPPFWFDYPNWATALTFIVTFFVGMLVGAMEFTMGWVRRTIKEVAEETGDPIDVLEADALHDLREMIQLGKIKTMKEDPDDSPG